MGAQFRNQNHAQSLSMNQSRSRSTNHILHLTQSPLICPTPNLSHTTLHLTLRHLPYLSLNLFLKYITPNLNPYITPNLNHIIPLSLSITLPSPSTTHPHPSR